MERRVYVFALFVFAVSAWLTLSSVRMMGAATPMPGGWMLATAWVKMPGKTWLGAGVLFALTWFVMMVAMMLPSSLPILLLYRRVLEFRAEEHVGALLLVMSAGYFIAWTSFGVVAYVVGVAVAQSAMRSSAISQSVPLAAGGTLIMAGVYQLTPWKTACLEQCRDPLEIVGQHQGRGWRNALELGAHHGVFCIACCWALMVMQLVLGVMNLWAMIGVALIIAIEKLARRGPMLARIVGIASIVAGSFYMLAFAHP